MAMVKGQERTALYIYVEMINSSITLEIKIENYSITRKLTYEL